MFNQNYQSMKNKLLVAFFLFFGAFALHKNTMAMNLFSFIE